jgi:hypothetical protein
MTYVPSQNRNDDSISADALNSLIESFAAILFQDWKGGFFGPRRCNPGCSGCGVGLADTSVD